MTKTASHEKLPPDRPAKPLRGRPVTGSAKTDAERMRAYRSRHVTVNKLMLAELTATPATRATSSLDNSTEAFERGYRGGERDGAMLETERLKTVLHALLLKELRGKRRISLQSAYDELFPQ